MREYFSESAGGGFETIISPRFETIMLPIRIRNRKAIETRIKNKNVKKACRIEKISLSNVESLFHKSTSFRIIKYLYAKSM